MSVRPIASAKTPQYPFWCCPVFCCDYRSSYAKNIEKHLLVHGWPQDRVNAELDRFFNSVGVALIICDKADDDPTKPKGV